MIELCEMIGVRELTEGYPVQLGRNRDSGRLVVRAKNEGGNNVTEIDLLDLIQWLRLGHAGNGTDGIHSAGDRAST